MIRPLSNEQYAGINLRHLPDGRVQLLEPIQLQDGSTIEPGFTCDLDSVARELGLLYAWFKGRTVLAAIGQDFRYRTGYDRAAADKEFLQIMEWEGVRTRYRVPIYWAVRLGGGRHHRG